MKRVMFVILVGVVAFLSWRFVAFSDAADAGDAARPSASRVDTGGPEPIQDPKLTMELSDSSELSVRERAPAARDEQLDAPPVPVEPVAPERTASEALEIAKAQAASKLREFLEKAKPIAVERLRRGEFETVPLDAPSLDQGPNSEVLFVLSSMDESGSEPKMRRVVLRRSEEPELAPLKDDLDAAMMASQGQY